MKKKAQGLSLNTIIIAAIVLIVLIVLWAIFTGRMGGFSLGATATQSCKDACKALGKGTDTCGAQSATKGTNHPGYIGQYSDATGAAGNCCCS